MCRSAMNVLNCGSGTHPKSGSSSSFSGSFSVSSSRARFCACGVGGLPPQTPTAGCQFDFGGHPYCRPRLTHVAQILQAQTCQPLAETLQLTHFDWRVRTGARRDWS